MTAEREFPSIVTNHTNQTLGRPSTAIFQAKPPSEKTHLIPKQVGNDAVVDIDGVELVVVQGEFQQHAREKVVADSSVTRDIVREEVTGVFRLAVPFASKQAVEVLPLILFGILISNVAGVDSASVLAASALADFFSAQVVFNIMGGVGSALETVCAQSFGAKQYAQLCLYAQAGLIAVAYCTPLVAVLSLNGATLFKLIGQDPNIAERAAVFTSISVLALPFISCYTVASSVLFSQQIVTPLVMITIVANAVALSLAYVLGFYTQLGYVGALYGMATTPVIKCMMVTPLLIKSPAFAAEEWPGFQWREAHTLMWRLVPLGTSSILMVTFQALGLNAVGLLCGYLPNVAQSMAANAIAGSLFSLAIVPSVGAFASGCIRVGTTLGSGNARRAAVAGTIGAAMTIAVAVVSALVSACVANAFFHGFTQDNATVEAALALYYRLLPSIPLLGWMLGVQGTLRACGKQWLIAQLSFVCLFVVGVPVGLWLAITCELGVQGVWYGQMIGIFICSAVTTGIVSRLDWDNVAREAYRNTHQPINHKTAHEPDSLHEVAGNKP